MYGQDKKKKMMKGGMAKKKMMKGGIAKKRTMYKDGGMSKANPC